MIDIQTLILQIAEMNEMRLGEIWQESLYFTLEEILYPYQGEESIRLYTRELVKNEQV